MRQNTRGGSTKKESNCWETCNKEFEKLLSHLPLVYPDDKMKVRWDCVLVFPRFYFMCLVPVDLAWTKE